MAVVVDTSVIIAVLVNEKSKSRIIKVTKGEELIAPHSLHWEIGNAFSAMQKRKKIEINSVKKALNFYSDIPIRFVDIDLFETAKIVEEYKIYAYDAYFLECAKRYNSAIISLDKRLLKIAEKLKIKFIEI